MTLIVCVDDNMGMLFNHRRQSKDVVVRERILKQAEGKHLWMNHYSAKQFDPEALINADESFMNEAAPEDVCFAEDCSVAHYEQWIDRIILYRVTPVFDGNNLVASGVVMEAESVEDKGDGILFCVFCYNVQPGVSIDYATGDSQLDGSAAGGPTTKPSETTPAVTEPEPQAPTETQPQGQTYVLNTNTHKFHYPSCSSAGQIKSSNRQDYTGSRSDLIAMGYDPCKRCKP